MQENTQKEIALCIDCEWNKDVEDCERDRGHEGPCPACGSARTKSAYVSEHASENQIEEEIAEVIASSVDKRHSDSDQNQETEQ